MPGQTPESSAARTAEVQALFVHHAFQLRGFVVALMPDLALVDDIVQETFLTVTAKAGTFDADRDFLPWACGVARFKIMEARRKAARQCQPLSEEVLEALCAAEPPATPDEERLARLVACLEKLPRQSRRIVELFYQQAHKPAEIARHVGWSVNAVYVALSRARTALRQCVERKGALEAAQP